MCDHDPGYVKKKGPWMRMRSQVWTFCLRSTNNLTVRIPTSAKCQQFISTACPRPGNGVTQVPKAGVPSLWPGSSRCGGFHPTSCPCWDQVWKFILSLTLTTLGPCSRHPLVRP